MQSYGSMPNSRTMLALMQSLISSLCAMESCMLAERQQESPALPTQTLDQLVLSPSSHPSHSMAFAQLLQHVKKHFAVPPEGLWRCDFCCEY